LALGTSNSDTVGIPGDRICSLVERIERIDEKITALNEAMKEILADAKCEGFEAKVLKVLRLRKLDKDERDERESLLDLDLRAVEGAGAPGVKAV